MGLQRKIAEFAVERHLIVAGERILVAVSGGPDSVTLLHLLWDLKDELNLHLEVAHLQHGIRGAAAEEDGRFVAALADKLKLPFHLKELDLPRMKSDAGKGNLEELARVERYRFFAEVVRERKLDKVATAHTQDDQAETVLLWILRGAGMKGMGGMAPLHQVGPADDREETLVVIRPLLEISKVEILEYLREKAWPYQLDRSNWDRALLRNWLRLELLPSLQRRTGENIAARLSRAAELMRDEDQLLNELARDRFATMVDRGRIDRRRFLLEPKPLQRRILRLWIESFRGHLRGLDFVHVDALLRFIGGNAPQGRISIPGGWECVREYDRFKLEKRSRRVERPCYSYVLQIGAVLKIPEAGLEMQSEQTKARGDRLPAQLSEAIFDAELLTERLIVRNFRPGDQIQPLNMGGHKKVKDLFIDAKVPLSIRATWPLLVAKKNVLWIPKYARSEIARVSEKTTSILRIKVVSIGG